MTTPPTSITFPGLYDAGRGDGARDALVRATLTRLEIRDRRGLLLSVWPYADVEPRPPADPTKALHVGCRTKPAADLAVLDPAFAGVLRERLAAVPRDARGARAAAATAAAYRGAGAASETVPPKVAPKVAPRPAPRLPPLPGLRQARRGLLAAALVAAGIGLYGLAAVTAPLIAPRFADRIPPDWSAAWGTALTAAAGPQCDAAAGREALETLTGRLQAAAGLAAPLTVTVVDDPLAEARALPGGHILLTRGLLDLLRTPDELAGVLANEVAAGERLGPERAILANLRLPELVSLRLRGAGMTPADLSAALVRARLAGEEQAALDARTLALLTAAGLRTRGLAAFHDVLASRAAQDGREPLYARTHAADRDRLDRLRAGPAGGAAALGYVQWEAVKALCATMPASADDEGDSISG